MTSLNHSHLLEAVINTWLKTLKINKIVSELFLIMCWNPSSLSSKFFSFACFCFFSISFFMCVFCLLMFMCTCGWGTGAPGNRESPCGCWDPSLVLCKNSKCSELPSQLSRPLFLFSFTCPVSYLFLEGYVIVLFIFIKFFLRSVQSLGCLPIHA